MFAAPIVGKVVTVITEHLGFASQKYRNTLTGRVLPSQKWDQPGTFRVATDRYKFPAAVVTLENVVSLAYADGAKVVMTAAKPAITVKRFRVKSGSRSGGFYVVSQAGAKFSCECKGYEFRRNCQHIHKVVEYLKKSA